MFLRTKSNELISLVDVARIYSVEHETGGHSIVDEEPKFGLFVTGTIHPDRIVSNAGARPGDVLVLTKPIGTGVLTIGEPVRTRSFEDTVRDYLGQELVNHSDEQRLAVLEKVEALMREVQE